MLRGGITEYHREIIGIVQRLQEINLYALQTGNAKFLKVSSECEAAKEAYDAYRNQYMLALEKQRLLLLRAQAEERRRNQSKLGSEHNALLSNDNPRASWGEKDDDLSKRVIDEAKQLHEIENQIQESTQLIEACQAKVKAADKGEQDR